MSTSSSLRRCRQFSIKEMKEATNQFDRSKILGQGGEAKVYYAEIYIDSNKSPVAVKHLKGNSKEFQREVHTLSKIQHPNLVSLIGYCDESGHKILVYEYMAKGCLSDYLKKKSHVSLSWLQRLNICLDAARGLQHLHTETDEYPYGIIHRDVKPGNILVGENWVGKLSDFGMFKFSTAGQKKSLMTTNLKGTCGYYAPEYIKYRCVTRKIDVYAFGVVLFQVLCRKMPWDREDESYYVNEEEDLGFWAQLNVDARIQGEISRDSLMLFTDIIGRSLQANPERRPTMDGVVLDLQKALECQEQEDSSRRLEGVASKVKVHTFKEVSKHNNIEDCWIMICGKVYDVTNFLDDHPGGAEVLLGSVGKDATEDFERVKHSDTTIEMMEKYYIGKLKVYTLEEVSRHNKRNDCWIIAKGKVYNLTPDVGDMPQVMDDATLYKVELLTLLAGRDATFVFEDVGYSEDTKKMMESYYVGDVDVNTFRNSTTANKDAMIDAPSSCAIC